MQVLKTINEVRAYSLTQKQEGNTIGFVPTMGALHRGHASLVEISAKANKITIASIFVNPIQFNNPSDLEKYPRTIEQDLQLLEKTGCSAVFIPDEKEMYKDKLHTTINFGALENVMEGAFRPGHFSGVGVVVSKLFNIVLPDHAYFGQKDLQQVLVIQQLVRDLSFPVTIHSCPILREVDGLAMSSRNVRLSKENRPLAAKIYEALSIAAKDLQKEGIENTKKNLMTFLNEYKPLELEYFEVADGSTLEPLQSLDPNKRIALCIAVFLDGVRLIDNIVIDYN